MYSVFKVCLINNIVLLLFFLLTVEVDDLKKISNSLSVLLSEKQKQEKVSDLILTCSLYSVGGAVHLAYQLCVPS